jgi:hypothetical protein
MKWNVLQRAMVIALTLNWLPFVQQGMFISVVVFILRIDRNWFYVWILVCSFQFELERKNGSFIWSWNETYVSIILAYNWIGYNKTEANSVFVNMSSTLNKTKEFEKFILVFIRNSDTSVYYINYQEVTAIWCIDTDINRDHSFSRELQGIWLKTKKDLHHSLLICFYHLWSKERML